MGSDSDRLSAAKRWLLRLLEKAFIDTSLACRSRLDELEYPPEATGAGDLIVCDAIRQFRGKSLECIPEGFDRIFAATRELQHGAADDLVGIAKDRTWEVIEQSFNWTTKDRSKPSRFEDWLAQARVNFWVNGVLMVSPECNLEHSPLAERLNCDFRAQFDWLLNQLRDEVLSNPTAQSTKPADSSDSNANRMQSDLVHSDDYRTVTVRDKQYTLTPNQARIIQTLDEAAARGIYAVSTAALRKSIGSPQSRIKDSFRSGDGRKFWEEFVVQTVRGMYVLKLPPRH